MATTITAGNGTNGGAAVSSDNTGILELKTGTGAGTTAMTIGTDQSVTFAAGTSINGITVGRGGGSVATNTAVGASALAANTTGTGNQAFGVSAGAALTTGNNNTALGRLALATATTPDQNTALGYAALYLTTTGQFNTGVGGGALQNNTTSSNNTAVGYRAGFSQTTGGSNTAIGREALYSSTGSENTAVGDVALYSNTTGSYNAALGRFALYSNTTASNNTAVGHQAGYSNTTGTGNVFNGYFAGYNVTGNYNTAIGRYAMGDTGTKSADYNTAVGNAAGALLTTGANNTFIGEAAGYSVTSGGKNTIVGRYTGSAAPISATGSNFVVLSDGDGNVVATLKSAGGIFEAVSAAGAGTNTMKYNTNNGRITYDTSSARYKDNIRDSGYGLSHVMQMRSTMFEYKDTGRTDVGLIAEELDLIIPELVTKNAEGQPDAVSYDRMVSVLVKAIQELKTEFDAYKDAHP